MNGYHSQMLLSFHDAITATREPNILFLTGVAIRRCPLPVFLPKPKPVRIAAV